MPLPAPRLCAGLNGSPAAGWRQPVRSASCLRS
jgi:hypothetical protein